MDPTDFVEWSSMDIELRLFQSTLFRINIGSMLDLEVQFPCSKIPAM